MIQLTGYKHYIYETKCTGDYVGEYINNLTLAQLKTLDCNLQLEDHIQQESTPPACSFLGEKNHQTENDSVDQTPPPQPTPAPKSPP